MKRLTVRQVAFTLHRYIGLGVALILIVIGLTGSFLVFGHEIDHFLVHLQSEKIVPQGERMSLESVVAIVETAYQDSSAVKVESVGMPTAADEPYQIWLESPDEKWTEVLVNPYTGTLLLTRQWEKTLTGMALNIHYFLLAGETGIMVAGITALLLFILSLTGIILWPGWRKLIAGFKIKWNAHPKRVNFDIHKVAGIIAAGFLAVIGLTGFCWNFYDFTTPIIYAATFTAPPPELASTVVEGKAPLTVSELLQKAETVFPDGDTTYVNIPTTPDAAFGINKRVPGEKEYWGRSRLYLDQYTGEVLHVYDVRSLPLGERVLDGFGPLHYGTFGGLPTRILYVFVGLSPTVLAITGWVMWRYRYRSQLAHQARLLAEQEQSSGEDLLPLSPWPWF